MGALSKWAKDNSPFLKLEEGESVTGPYGGFKESSYLGKALIEYTIGDKILSSSSGKLAMRMDNIKVGDEIKIIRFGAGMNTNYEVEVVGKAETPVEAQPQSAAEQEKAWDD